MTLAALPPLLAWVIHTILTSILLSKVCTRTKLHRLIALLYSSLCTEWPISKDSAC